MTNEHNHWEMVDPHPKFRVLVEGSAEEAALLAQWKKDNEWSRQSIAESNAKAEADREAHRAACSEKSAVDAKKFGQRRFEVTGMVRYLGGGTYGVIRPAGGRGSNIRREEIEVRGLTAADKGQTITVLVEGYTSRVIG